MLGAFLIEPLNEWPNNNLGGGNSRLLIFGGLMALVVLFLPRGHHPALEDLLEARRKRGKAGLVGARLELRERDARPAAAPGAQRPRRCSRSRAWRSASAACARSTAPPSTVPEGSITALIGPNGSGKTTVFNLIDGTMAAERRRGLVRRRADRRPAAVGRARYAGLGRTFQITRLFREMTVLENVVAPLRGFSLGPAQRRRA